MDFGYFSRIEPTWNERRKKYERKFSADIGSWLGVLTDPDECHNGTLEQFEKFKVKVYTLVKVYTYS